MKPIILITGEEGYDLSMHTPNFVVSKKYSECISKSGGVPFTTLDVRVVNEYAKIADGLLLTGGPNMHVARYNEYYASWKDMNEAEISFRDEFEFKLFKSFMKVEKPIFGIGRGMQVINVALGGTLIRNIIGDKVDTPHSYKENHKVILKSKTKLFKVLDKSLSVNSFHEQAVKEIGDGLIVAANASDGIVEALEHEKLPIFGVQWHPEICETDDNYPLFKYFIKLCRGEK